LFARNLYLADSLDELALLLEIDGSNFFKVKAYKDAARTIRAFETPVNSVLQLENIKGIGPGIKKVVERIISGEEPEEMIELKKKIPAGILEIARLPGLGPKSLRTLLDERITDLDTLEQRAREHTLREIPGFGAKTEYRILADLELLKGHKDLFLGAEALEIAKELQGRLFEHSDVSRVEITGELRRFEPLVSQIELLVEKRTDFTEKMLLDSLGIKYDARQSRLKTGYPVKIHFSKMAKKAFGSKLLETTGPREFLTRFGEIPALDDEKELFRQQGYNYLPPEVRHHKEAAKYLTRKLPELIELKDIKGDLHMHSRYSDGAVNMLEMAISAQEMGYKYIAITDHSQSLTIARGLTPERLLEQKKEIQKIGCQLDIKVFHGTEVDILKDGSLDFPDEVLEKLDFVIASVHSNFRQTKTEMTERIIKAMENPYVKVIGHISGRMLARRPGYELDWERILKAAQRTKTALELNSTPNRLDVTEDLLETVIDSGVKLMINTDAHSIEGLKYILWGVMTARRALITKDYVINTYSLQEITKWLDSK